MEERSTKEVADTGNSSSVVAQQSISVTSDLFFVFCFRQHASERRSLVGGSADMFNSQAMLSEISDDVCKFISEFEIYQ